MSLRFDLERQCPLGKSMTNRGLSGCPVSYVNIFPRRVGGCLEEVAVFFSQHLPCTSVLIIAYTEGRTLTKMAAAARLRVSSQVATVWE